MLDFFLTKQRGRIVTIPCMLSSMQFLKLCFVASKFVYLLCELINYQGNQTYFVKETLLALVRDLFTFSSKVIKRFMIV
jgi:hypothetical protein